jgi:hypothetical protein
MTLPVAQPPTSGKQLISFDSANQNPELLYNIHFPLDDNPVAGPSLLPSESHNSGQTQTLNTQQKNKKSMENIGPKRAAKKCWKCEMEDCGGRIRKNLCKNACASCNSKECKGKDSRHPSNPCEMLLKAHNANKST